MVIASVSTYLSRSQAFFSPLILALSLLLSGCVTGRPLPGPGDGTSVFVHPNTGEVKHCENPGATSVFRGGILAIQAYADCKTSAEDQGFVRVRQ